MKHAGGYLQPPVFMLCLHPLNENPKSNNRVPYTKENEFKVTQMRREGLRNSFSKHVEGIMYLPFPFNQPLYFTASSTTYALSSGSSEDTSPVSYVLEFLIEKRSERHQCFIICEPKTDLPYFHLPYSYYLSSHSE